MYCCLGENYATMEPLGRKVVPMFKLIEETNGDFSHSKQYEGHNCTLQKIEIADGSGEVNYLVEHHDLLFAPKMMITDQDILFSFHDLKCNSSDIPRICSNLVDCENFCKEFKKEKENL